MFFYILFYIYVVKSEYAYITPHGHEIGLFNSAIGILACSINLKHVASWPNIDMCNPKCIRLFSNNKSKSYDVFAIDRSTGSYDVSISAYRYITGNNYGGKKKIYYEILDPKYCDKYWNGGLIGINANAFYTCNNNSYIKKKGKLIDYKDSYCKIGTNKECIDNQCRKLKTINFIKKKTCFSEIEKMSPKYKFQGYC